jgi:predicted nucleotidyltransferase
MIDHAEIVHIGDIAIRLVSLEDLLELKRMAGRQQDLADLDALSRLKNL